MTEKLHIPFFFAHKALHFLFNERLLDSSSCNFGLRLTTEYFRGRGRGGGVIVCHRVACFDDSARRCVQEKQRDVTPHSPIWTPETCRLVIMLKSQYKNTTGKINQSDGSNTRSRSAACRMRARQVPICICPEVITNTRGGGTPTYKPYSYVPPHRVGFLRRFGLKTGKHYAHFSLESGMVL